MLWDSSKENLVAADMRHFAGSPLLMVESTGIVPWHFCVCVVCGLNYVAGQILNTAVCVESACTYYTMKC